MISLLSKLKNKYNLIILSRETIVSILHIILIILINLRQLKNLTLQDFVI